MAIQDSLPWPPPAATAPPRPGRGRRRWSYALAVLAVIGLVTGLLVWAPWHKVPTTPAAVHAQSPTATSVLVSWTPGKGGTRIDHYLVLRDGTQVGSVPVSRTSYTDTGLTPGSSHRYTVIAATGKQRSLPSVKAAVTTITPSPVGLSVGQETWTTAVFHWSPSPQGPAPDEYTIYKGSTSVAVLPGTADSYSVTGLTPGTPNQFQVSARWGQRESGRSSVLSVVTLALPLQGDVPVQFRTVTTPGGGASLSPGQKWSDSWTFTSDCTGNSCTLTADAEFAAPGFSVQSFTLRLTASGSGYAGSAKAKITKCRSVTVQNTITLHIAADKGAVNNGGWNAWSGSMDLESPYVTADSNFFCPQQSWSFAVTGTHS